MDFQGAAVLWPKFVDCAVCPCGGAEGDAVGRNFEGIFGTRGADRDCVFGGEGRVLRRGDVGHTGNPSLLAAIWTALRQKW